ncbi:hypothetical protein GOP47_0028144 [Adiantum capillus-veneris]|nr:hypothetical protein GOP47_0028144 [Adiantum capillus-veneris]
MTTHHRHSQADGRPPKIATHYETELIWSPARKSVMWAACLLLIAFLIFASIFSSDSLINLIAEEQAEIVTGTISPSTQDHIPPPPPDSDVKKLIDFSVGGCNIWRGDWIRHPDEPPYTNWTCPYIQANQNCIKLGRPDLDFLQWRWKPHDCELPLFDGKSFLKILAGKKWAFIGDSLARNNYQSVLCHLAQVETPECTYNDGWDGNVHWLFPSYNFTLAVAWAPFLVQGLEQAEGYAERVAKLDLDVLDQSWAPAWVHDFDYIVLSAARWYLRTSVYFVQNELVGCNMCPMLNATDLGWAYAYRAALRTSFDFLISSNYTGVVFFRTFSPEHWENAAWDQGGNCTQKSPFKSKSHALDGLSQVIYAIQLEEFGKTVQRSSEYSFKLKIVDTLHAAVLRPDAHPGPYGHFHPRVTNDCVHWCLPGAVDSWSAMILHVLKHL